MKKRDYVLNTTDGEFLDITAFGTENLNDGPCIIFVHGFKGFKDWGFGPYMAEKLAESGFFVITFNFSFNGVGRNSLEFTELEKFERNTFSREVGELSLVTDAWNSGFFGDHRNKKIAFIGHSRGGAIAALTAAKRYDINALVLWASVSHLDRYSARQKEKWRKTGYFEVLNQRTKQIMKLNVTLLDDLEQNKDELNIENAIKKLKCPIFIAHGEQDLAVPLREGEQLFEWAQKQGTEFLRIPQTGHTFNMSHPFNGSNQKFDLLLQSTRNFLIDNLI